MGLFLHVAANTKITTAALRDTFNLRNNQVAAPPSISSNSIHDAAGAGIGHNSPLLLTLFKVSLNYEKVLIDWSTAEERNNKFFTVERSADGVHFDFLSFLVAGNDPSLRNDYRLIDHSPKEGLNYYRLSQTDMSGQIICYGTRIINYQNSKDFSAGVINISNGNIKIIINSSRKDELRLDVVDINGKQMIYELFAVATGSTAKTFLMQKGTYVAVLTNSAGEKSVNKIVVQ